MNRTATAASANTMVKAKKKWDPGFCHLAPSRDAVSSSFRNEFSEDLPVEKPAATERVRHTNQGRHPMVVHFSRSSHGGISQRKGRVSPPRRWLCTSCGTSNPKLPQSARTPGCPNRYPSVADPSCRNPRCNLSFSVVGIVILESKGKRSASDERKKPLLARNSQVEPYPKRVDAIKDGPCPKRARRSKDGATASVATVPAGPTPSPPAAKEHAPTPAPEFVPLSLLRKRRCVREGGGQHLLQRSLPRCRYSAAAAVRRRQRHTPWKSGAPGRRPSRRPDLRPTFRPSSPAERGAHRLSQCSDNGAK